MSTDRAATRRFFTRSYLTTIAVICVVGGVASLATFVISLFHPTDVNRVDLFLRTWGSFYVAKLHLTIRSLLYSPGAAS